MLLPKSKFFRLVLMIAALSGSYSFAQAGNTDGIAAIVNQHIITQSQLEKHIRLVGEQMQAAHVPLPRKILKQHVSSAND